MNQRLVGLGAKNLRQIFKDARSSSPSVIFIDEIDSFTQKRKKDNSQFQNNSLNQLLAEMDGFVPNEQVVVLAATNLEESIDEALKRPGRFDLIIPMSVPMRND